MKATRSVFTLAAVLLALILPASVFSAMKDMPMGGHQDGHEPMMGMGNMDRMDSMMGMCIANADKIGLSDEQVAKMKPLHMDMQKKQARFKADQKIAEIELMETMEVKDFDLEKASAAVKKIGDIKTAHHLEMLKSMKEIRTVLTDDQYKKMKKMMSMKMGEKMPAKRMMKKN